MTNEPSALPVLVFDGDCAMCSSLARRTRRWLHVERVEPWQRLDLASIGLDEQRCQAALQWVGADGSIDAAERAVISALRYAGGVWRLPAVVLAAPGIRLLAAAAYRWVARNRHRLPGGTPACQR